jgi:hypothetical protein
VILGTDSGIEMSYNGGEMKGAVNMADHSTHFLLKDIDLPLIVKEIDTLRSRYPSATPGELSRKVIDRGAAHGAALGAVAGALPFPWSLMGIMGEVALMQYLQSRLVLTIALLHGYEPTNPERALEVLGCMGHTAGAVAGIEGIRHLVRRGAGKILIMQLRTRIFQSLIGRILRKAAPFIGAASGGAINYGVLQSCGNIALAYYHHRKTAEDQHGTAPVTG